MDVLLAKENPHLCQMKERVCRLTGQKGVRKFKAENGHENVLRGGWREDVAQPVVYDQMVVGIWECHRPFHYKAAPTVTKLSI